MGTGVGEVNTDVPMLVIDQQPTVGGKRVFTDGSGQRVPSVLCPTFEELEEYDEQEEDSPNETNMVPERRLHDSKTDIEITPGDGSGGAQGRNGGDDEPSCLRRGS